jgi:ribosomal protein S18 acetylase RimI-like enzyme
MMGWLLFISARENIKLNECKEHAILEDAKSDLMGVEIRPATKEDLPTCSKIMVDEFRKQGEDWNMDSAKARLTELIEDSPNLCFCIKLEEELIGCIFMERFKYLKGNYLMVSEFVISSAHQGRGYGLEALRFIEKLGKERGFDVLTLAANKKEKAFRIYEKFGLGETGYFFMEKGL